jgi:hypothetical protein
MGRFKRHQKSKTTTTVKLDKRSCESEIKSEIKPKMYTVNNDKKLCQNQVLERLYKDYSLSLKKRKLFGGFISMFYRIDKYYNGLDGSNKRWIYVGNLRLDIYSLTRLRPHGAFETYKLLDKLSILNGFLNHHEKHFSIFDEEHSKIECFKKDTLGYYITDEIAKDETIKKIQNEFAFSFRFGSIFTLIGYYLGICCIVKFFSPLVAFIISLCFLVALIHLLSFLKDVNI